MAQSVEHFVHIEGVVGSSPTVTTEKSGRRSRSTLAGFFLRTLLRTPKGTHEGYAEGTQKSLRAVVNKNWTRIFKNWSDEIQVLDDQSSNLVIRL